MSAEDYIGHDPRYDHTLEVDLTGREKQTERVRQLESDLLKANKRLDHQDAKIKKLTKINKIRAAKELEFLDHFDHILKHVQDHARHEALDQKSDKPAIYCEHAIEIEGACKRMLRKISLSTVDNVIITAENVCSTLAKHIDHFTVSDEVMHWLSEYAKAKTEYEGEI